MSVNGLVLGGGGSRGAYQIGAIIALNELGFKYEIVTGTSVGALNTLFLGSNQFDLLKEVWGKMDFEKIFDHKYKFKNKTLETFLVGLFKGGISLKSLELLIRKYLDVDELIKSNIKTGIVYTSPLKKYTPIQIKNVNKDEICDYLIASCSPYPFVKKKNIDGKKCYDGCYNDNLPITLAIEMGANKIIAIDICKGVRKKVDTSNIDYLYLKPHRKLPYFMDFSNEKINEMIKNGYNDIMIDKDRILDFINN